MEFIYIFIISSVIAFLGLAGGVIASRSNKQELKPGKNYFILIQKILFLAIFIASVIYFDLNIILSFIIIAIAFLFCFLRNLQKFSIIIYILLGIILFLSSRIKQLFFLNCALIFLFGIPTGTMIQMKKKNIIVEIMKHIGFFICILLFFIFSF
ncbi:hypothetical protein KY336_04575 [Candidatus Woesearchaeota archaeon]|nr:hypothetical protein [Candidatus Woesearchaeota archaeon]